MDYGMQKANLLAENINEFIKYVHKNYQTNNSIFLNRDKLLQIKLLVEEFKFQIISDELWRINQFSWDEKYTLILVEQFTKGMETIEEYVKHHYDDLFMLSARLNTLRSLSISLSGAENSKYR